MGLYIWFLKKRWGYWAKRYTSYNNRARQYGQVDHVRFMKISLNAKKRMDSINKNIRKLEDTRP